MAGLYSVEREIGRGAAARVFLAHDPQGQAVVLKILHPELLVSVTADRFLREIGILRRLHHPRISHLIDTGERDWLVYYVMPFIEGPTLKHALHQYHRFSAQRVATLASEVLAGLDYAHQQGVIHRDVKPDNIVMGPNGAVLLDFGIARAIEVSGSERLTRSGIAIGTSTYMSPEQVAAETDIDLRTDLYALGCVLFECLAGHPPFQHPNEVVVLQMHQTEPVPDVRTQRPETPAVLAEIIMRAMAKRREERFASAAEMAAGLVAEVG
ncbi:MAG: serine/threonine-protein kinase [Gemmatimonadales bacterium]